MQESMPQGPDRTPRSENQVLMRRVYDQNLSDWSSRYKKNKASLDLMNKECEQLRTMVAKHQSEVDMMEQAHENLDRQYNNETLVRLRNVKEGYDEAQQAKGMLSLQLAEQRKLRTQLQRERKVLSADYNRKHAELTRMIEQRDRLEETLAQQSSHLGQLATDRRRMERELDSVQQNLRQNTDVVDEVTHDMSNVKEGIKDSVKCFMTAPSMVRGRPDNSTSLSSSTRSKKDLGY